MKKTITVIIPVFNESGAIEQNLPAILTELSGIQTVNFTFLLVDDGSKDNTAAWIKDFCRAHPSVELLCLSRNFGKEAAIHAGLDYAQGDAAIVMDSDLQHPPALIPQMINLWQQGIDVVEACKSSRGKETFAAQLLARGFYRLFNWLAGMNIQNHSDFKLLDRKVVEAYRALPERKRFFRGLIAWMGFPSAQLFFEVPERQYGSSAWSKLRLWRFSLTALTSFSSIPLHFITSLAIIGLTISMLLGGIALYDKYTGQAVSGFTTVILLILIMGSLIMLGLGIIGLYLEQIFTEIKHRPTYLIDWRKSTRKKES